MTGYVFLGCLLFLKLVKLDFSYVVYPGLDCRHAEMLTRKIKKMEIANV